MMACWSLPVGLFVLHVGSVSPVGPVGPGGPGGHSCWPADIFILGRSYGAVRPALWQGDALLSVEIDK